MFQKYWKKNFTVKEGIEGSNDKDWPRRILKGDWTDYFLKDKVMFEIGGIIVQAMNKGFSMEEISLEVFMRGQCRIKKIIDDEASGVLTSPNGSKWLNDWITKLMKRELKRREDEGLTH